MILQYILIFSKNSVSMMKSELIISILEAVEEEKTSDKDTAFKEPDKRKKSLVRTLTRKHLRMTNKKTGIPKVKTGVWVPETPDLNFKNPHLV